ncbi:MAG: phosphate acyltransferase PlsX [Fimbriimonadales bacterium]|nr:phosphate acyltransferase PlsX [Fimbriimonadales bacterium]
MNIALDAMGGDHAPDEIVAGAVLASPDIRGQITLVGQPERIHPLLPRPCPPNLAVHGASQVIEMSDKPIDALRKKRDSSLVVAAELVKAGAADAMVSAGNTGAAAAGCLLAWRQIPGFHRPAIACTMPRRRGTFLLLDAGASPDVDPEHLVEFALMGRAYAERAMDRPNPGVHLLNIGEEEGKGNAFAKEAYRLLSKHPWFRGNIEGKEMFEADTDVVVCDAFVGNVVLKTSEGVAELLIKMIRDEVPKNALARLPYLPLKRLFGSVRRRLDYAEYGGSPLLGLNGLCIICHGRSNAKAIRNALLQAQTSVEHGVVECMRESAKNRS